MPNPSAPVSLSRRKFLDLLQKMVELYARQQTDISQAISEDVNQDLAALKIQIAQLLQKGDTNTPEGYAVALRNIDGRLTDVIRQLRTISDKLEAPGTAGPSAALPEQVAESLVEADAETMCALAGFLKQLGVVERAPGAVVSEQEETDF